MTKTDSPVTPPPAPASGLRARGPGDVHAFLAEVLSPRARPWRRLRLGRADGQDALQGALVRFLAHVDDIQPQSRRGWLRTAMLHEKLCLVEKEARRQEHAPEIEAHLRDQCPPFPSPDAESALRDVLGAVSALLEQVKPDRRVVAGWCIWRLLFAEEVELEALADMLEIPRGTLNSKWDRAKEDMRAALDRERSKARDRSKMAVLLAALAAVWLWFLARGRRVADAIAGELRRSFPALSSGGGGRRAAFVVGAIASENAPAEPVPSSGARRRRAALVAGAIAASARRTVGRRVRGTGARAAFACAVLPLALLSHDPFGAAPSSAEVFAASYEAIAGETYREAEERREVDRSMYAPFLTTNAERERAWGVGAVHAARAGAARARAGAPGELPPVGAVEVDPGEVEIARGLLARAVAAIGQGDLDIARDALRTYDGAVLNGVFDSERIRLGGLLSAAEKSR